MYTQNRSHDPNARVFSGFVRSSDAEFGERREAGRGELRAAAFGWHGYEIFPLMEMWMLSLIHRRVVLQWCRLARSNARYLCRRVGIIGAKTLISS